MLKLGGLVSGGQFSKQPTKTNTQTEEKSFGQPEGIVFHFTFAKLVVAGRLIEFKFEFVLI